VQGPVWKTGSVSHNPWIRKEGGDCDSTADADDPTRFFIERSKVHQGHVHDIAFRPGIPSQFMTVGVDGAARIWHARADMLQGRQIAVLPQHSPVLCGDFSWDGNSLVVGLQDTQCRVWIFQESRWILSHSPRFHDHPVRSLCTTRLASLTDDGADMEDYVVSGDQQGVLRVWELDSGNKVVRLSGHTRSIRRVRMIGQSTLVATASRDATIRVWCLRAKQQWASFDLLAPSGGGLDTSVRVVRTASEDYLHTQIAATDTAGHLYLLTLKGVGTRTIEDPQESRRGERSCEPGNWFWLDNHERWQPFAEANNHLLEKAWREGQDRYIIKLDRYKARLDFIIDFQSLTQRSVQSGKLRAVERRVALPGCADVDGHGVWFWQDDGGAMTPYDPQLSADIERVFSRRQASMSFWTNDTEYVVTFQGMAQRNVRTGNTRSIERKVVH